ncbi:hypothetical protein FDP41_001934 [Naegleria fowleri]|uniref:Uncharacterized protein n=1 Tax=Naegleria fowleri TaxID=5763 RepID=A0A6A5BX23_NAEFO|nr:uncharacterized protein FDP41_001934 [Naegleria fowleri]KAF0978864.1 hypothetical protein FDP41_001934 [Naegleria fowleri]
MGIDVTVIMCNLRLLDDKVREHYLETASSMKAKVSDGENESERDGENEENEKDSEKDGDGDIENEDSNDESEKDGDIENDEDNDPISQFYNWKNFVALQKPNFYIDCFRFRATEMYSTLAGKLKLEECWSDESQLEDLLGYEITFEEDLKKEYHAKKKGLIDEQVEVEKLRYPNLLTICDYYNERDDYCMTFVHPSRVSKMSERCGHFAGIPLNVLEEGFMQEYEEYYLKSSKKLKTEEEEKKPFEKWVYYEYDHISLFHNMMLRYNSPTSFFTLLPKTPIDNSQPVIKLFENGNVKFSDLADEYWITVMQFIEDPFTLLRFAMANSVLYRIFTERKDDLFRNFQHLKADIGLFCYLS